MPGRDTDPINTSIPVIDITGEMAPNYLAEVMAARVGYFADIAATTTCEWERNLMIINGDELRERLEIVDDLLRDGKAPSDLIITRSPISPILTRPSPTDRLLIMALMASHSSDPTFIFQRALELASDDYPEDNMVFVFYLPGFDPTTIEAVKRDIIKKTWENQHIIPRLIERAGRTVPRFWQEIEALLQEGERDIPQERIEALVNSREREGRLLIGSIPMTGRDRDSMVVGLLI